MIPIIASMINSVVFWVQGATLRSHHAQALASYIKDIFLSGELLGERVEPSWKLDGPLSQVITSNKGTAF